MSAGKKILTLFFDGIYYVIWHLELLGGRQSQKAPCTMKNIGLGEFWVGIVGLMGQGGWWVSGQWLVGDTSFQKIFGLYGLGHDIRVKRWDVKPVDGQTGRTEMWK